VGSVLRRVTYYTTITTVAVNDRRGRVGLARHYSHYHLLRAARAATSQQQTSSCSIAPCIQIVIQVLYYVLLAVVLQEWRTAEEEWYYHVKAE